MIEQRVQQTGCCSGRRYHLAMRSWVVTLVAVIAATVEGPGARAQSRAWIPAVEPLPSPAASGTGEPQLTVSPRGVLLSWIERTGETAALKFAERTSTGWSETRTVASGSDWFVNWADVPSVVRLADGSIYGHWLQKSGPDTYAYDVRLARSTDDGRTFSTPFTPHDDRTRAEHGFASLFQMPGAGLGLVWLDGRAMVKPTGRDAHAEPSGAMSLRAAVYDRSGKRVREGPVDLRVCECCPTATAVTSDGPIVAYRDRSHDEIRDIYTSRFVDGTWTQPSPVHRDNWKIAACPVNGPALSAEGRTVAIAWFTAEADTGHAFVAFSSDAGVTFGDPIRLDEQAALGRVDVQLLDDGSAVATWIEAGTGTAQLAGRRVQPTGGKSASFAIAGLAATRASGYPRMARFGSEIVFAWTEAGETSRVRTAMLQLPRATSAK